MRSHNPSNLKKFLNFAGSLISTYLSLILTLGFLIPWLLGAFQIKNFDEIINLIEVFVLVSATLSLLSFTYIMASAEIHEKLKKSVMEAGELFFMSTVQFIIGLFLFLFMRNITGSFLNLSSIHLSLSLNGIISGIIVIIQLIIIFEIIFALSKFFRGCVGIYASFRTQKLRESIFYLILKNIIWDKIK
ncbi:MAG: hypothetical protein HZC47_06080 [Methanobacterium sp.]|uniref:hypothetical protein n=1 Tax=Methanobacterium sp. TaxID=2164 RepID=UPI003D64CBC5|nr:hypothetical protein [Methanobacterium sp.]